MKINTEWNSGSFNLVHEAEVPEDKLPVLAVFGLKYLVQRNREHDVILGAMTTVKSEAKEGAKGKGPWRRKDWKRNNVEFTETLAKLLEKSYSEVTLSEEEGKDAEKLVVATVATKYDGAKAEPKFQREKLKFAEKESTPEGLDGWLKRFAGYTGATHTEDGESYSPEALQAAKLAIDKFLATA